MNPLLTIEDLTITFAGRDEAAVAGVDLEVARGRRVGLVGESGSGKTLTALSAIGLLPPGARVTRGAVAFDGDVLDPATPRRWAGVRGRRVGMVFQDPLTSLTPYFTVGDQVFEAVRLHRPERGRAAWREVERLFAEVGLGDDPRLLDAFPHELSGGQRQRVAIAMALAGRPDLLIADEPTTALDVTVQARILELFESLCATRAMSLLLITHDLGVVRRVTDEVVVMKDGRVIERGPVGAVLEAPSHADTRELIAAVPRIEESPRVVPLRSESPPVLDARGITVVYRSRRGSKVAVDDAGLEVMKGETVAIVGESGSGKTSLARAILRLTDATRGTAHLRPESTANPLDLLAINGRTLRAARRHVQTVFQDPLASLNPRRSIAEAIQEPLRNFGLLENEKDAAARTHDLLEQVQLSPTFASRFPHELSGGQRQRVGIARALGPRPSLIILDEAVSALDVSVQSRILDLLLDLQRRYGLAYLFITHDLGVVRRIAHRVIVMKDGVIVEEGENGPIFSRPQEEYTQRLLKSVL